MVHVLYQKFRFVVNKLRPRDLVVQICHLVPIDHTIADILHLFLRVTDVLFNLLTIKVRRKDAVVRYMNESSLWDGCDNLHKLESFFTSRLSHSFQIPLLQSY